MSNDDTKLAEEATSADKRTELPQPPNGHYRYVHTRHVSKLSSSDSLSPGQLVWVCKSKGRKRKRNKQATTDTRSDTTIDKTSDSTNNSSTLLVDDSSNDSTCSQRLELFLRARVISTQDNEYPGRIRVQYPKGSTYACKPNHLLPILETTHNVVLVAPETCDYRRCCVIHTLPSENFLEVGCDFGVTTDRVYQTGSLDNRRVVVGVDKSSESIDIARQRFPHLVFIQCDILSEAPSDWPRELVDMQPHVIAVDINGNRELEAVCQSLRVLLKVYQPRLIIVKSRALDAKISEQKTGAQS